ncbi:MAG: hypothetical protein ACM31C_07600, partial [Acidobacteriota bacterium]
MRSTSPALLGLALATSACVDVPHRHYFNADGGTDGGSAARSCSDARLVTGDLTFSNADGALLLTGVPKSGSWKLAGKLTMTGRGVSSMAKLGDLCSVGDLELANTNLEKIDTTGPIEVVGDVSVHDNDQLADLTNIEPGADRIGSLVIEHNSALVRFDSFGSLRYVTNATAIRYNAALSSIDLHDVQRLEGGLDVSYDAALASLQLTSLQSVGDLTLSHDTKLATAELGALQYVHGSLT